jgi:hypothetical protein
MLVVTILLDVLAIVIVTAMEPALMNTIITMHGGR